MEEDEEKRWSRYPNYVGVLNNHKFKYIKNFKPFLQWLT